MRYLNIELSRELEYQYIVPISDLHIGDTNFNKERLEAVLEWTKRNDGLIILNGDILTADIKDSVGNVYHAIMTPQEQLDYAIDLFKPFKGRIIGIVDGNHEIRITREVGLQITKIFASSLGLEDKYDPVGILLHVRIGKDRTNKKIGYTIYSTHGWSNGKTIGSKLNAIQDLRHVAIADCYIASHTHLYGSAVEQIYTADVRNRKLLAFRQVFVSSGGYKDYGDFEGRKGLHVSEIGSPIIRLDGRKKLISVQL